MFSLIKNIFFIYILFLNTEVFSSIYVKENSIKEGLNCKFRSFENLSYLFPESEIHIRIPNSSKWNRNLFSAFLENKKYILEKYKKKFEANIILKNNTLKQKCSIPSNVRISGDLIDHIEIANKKNQPKTSLDVNLKKGNLNNITSFKLFIPETKRGENFIIFQSIMSELNFITPRNKMVDVKLNDNRLDKYLLVEKPSKEMTEFNKKKEGPIIAIDERDLWRKDNKRKDAYLPKLVNVNWAAKNDMTIKMTKEILDLISLTYLEYHQRHHIEKKNDIIDLNFKLIEKAGYNVNEIKRYNLALIAFNAQHGLQPNNRKYFFSPLEKKIYPISNDEDPLLTSYKKFNLKKKNFYIDFLEFSSFINELESLDLDKALLKIKKAGLENFEKEDLKKIILIAKENLIFYKKNHQGLDLSKSNFTKFFEKNKIFLTEKNYFTKYIDGDLILEVCDKKFQNCKIIEKDNKYLSKIFSNKIKGSKYIIDKNVYENDILKLNSEEKFLNFAFNKGRIFYNNGIEFEHNEKEKLFTITQLNNNARFVFHSVDLSNYKIIFIGKEKKNINNQIRLTKENLTGCLNIINASFKNTEIESSNTSCEDSVNIINSKGSLKDISIINSSYDGLDVDFSEIKFNKINIINSENDCLDFSYGKYEVSIINTSNCKDKAISLGEKSNLNLKKFESKNSKVGLAVKDSSVAIVEFVSLNNVENCVVAYRKKQEFSGGNVFIKHNNCLNKSFYKDNQSKIVLNDEF